MQRIIIVILFLYFNCIAYASSISGILIDSISHEPIAYGNAILTSKNDTSFLVGSITDDKGYFIIEGIPNGIYNLKISFIGYQSIIKNNIYVKKDTMLGVIKLSVISENLSEIGIIGNKVPVTYKVDRKVIDPGSCINGSVAMDMLKNVPSVQVDIEGNLTYRGDGNFEVFINGHPVSNGVEKLKQLSIAKIEKIEIITNPSAKYNAEGTAGIIQVILKRIGYKVLILIPALNFQPKKVMNTYFQLIKVVSVVVGILKDNMLFLCGINLSYCKHKMFFRTTHYS